MGKLSYRLGMKTSPYSLSSVIETKSAANVIERCGDTIQTMLNLSQFLDSDRERMDKLVVYLYDEAINLHKSAELQLQ